MTFDIETYLCRIGLGGFRPQPTAEGLSALQFAQMTSIAFENIDVLSGEVPKLDDQSVWEKLVARRRGGYCLELNHLFGQALENLGFAIRPVLGRVRMGAPAGGPRAHHAFVVTIDGAEWLADTGFGGPAPVRPVRLGKEAEQMIGGERFRIRNDARSGEEVLERLNGRDWFSLYGFDRVEVTPPDYEACNFVCARWEKSPFPTHLMMTIASDEGRVSLFNTQARKIGRNGEDIWTIGSGTELQRVWNEHFGLECGRELADAIFARIADPETRAA